MACRVPGCNTKYWNKQIKKPLFRAPSAKQLADWQKILRREGVSDFYGNDKVCISHFEENCIERKRLIYKRGGIVSEEPREVPLLSPTAVPTIFAPQVPTTEKKKQLNYAVVFDEKILSKQREIFKRKISSVGTLPNENEKDVKRLKFNNFFHEVLSAINNKERVSPHLDSHWIANCLGERCIILSMWATNRSGVTETIHLHTNLTVEFTVNEKKIFLPELENISDIGDLQTFFKKVSQIVPCKTANYDAKESENACTGFVVQSVGRPKSRYLPCCRYEKKRIRRKKAEIKIRDSEKKKRTFSVNKCINLRRKSKRLKIKVKTLKMNMAVLKKQCKEADKTAVERAIARLPCSEQDAVKSCFAASQLTDMRGMRYNTQWVYECLLLRIKSRKAYKHLRKRKILVLPGIATLNRYIKRIGECYGFQESLSKIIEEKTKKMKPDEVRGTLLIDEMKLTKALSFNRHNLRVEGFTDLENIHRLIRSGKKETTH